MLPGMYERYTVPPYMLRRDSEGSVLISIDSNSAFSTQVFRAETQSGLPLIKPKAASAIICSP